MKQIKKSVEIKSIPKNIWEVLFIDKNYASGQVNFQRIPMRSLIGKKAVK